jgi:hypothetical protein
MKSSENHNKYIKFRKEYPVFEFSESNITKKEGGMLLSFVYKVGKDFEFRPDLFFPFDDKSAKLSEDLLQTLAFNVGMVEMISYWKAFCSPTISIKPFRLKPGQENWWKKLFKYGLGEFFYTNGIEIPGEEMVQFSYTENVTFHGKFNAKTSPNEFLIPLGGGKDSVVTLALFQQNSLNTKIFVMNHRGATRDVLVASGIDEKDTIEVTRKIDPLLIELNQRGFLNGHTPFSALLAFVSVMVSAITGHGSIALSNESSANEPTIPGTIINHQYSKSLEFESDFRSYLDKYVATGINYFSFLRPLNELQIGALFAKYEKYHQVFKSCNVGSKTDSWCCNCSKCLFTYIILSPFFDEKDLVKIFGQNLFEKHELVGIMEELSGISENKPFECVGTIEEVNAALQKAIENYGSKELPVLLAHYQKNKNDSLYSKKLKLLLSEFQQPHFVEPRLKEILKQALRAKG